MDDESHLIALARREAGTAARPATLPAGFPGYRVLSEVHHGAQGVVYLAVQESTGQQVALKVLRAGPHAGEIDRARFLREVRVLARLEHPNIVSIHDTGSSAGGVYFVMDYVDGRPLDRWVADERPPVRTLLELFARICDAVHAAHLRGVIHRDLKPGNIRVDARGEPRVLDFGLAKVAEDEQEGGTTTMTGHFVGTVPWSAPEQAGGEAVDVRTDVYALGLLLYHMLTGRAPYDVTGNLRDVLDRIRHADPVRPSLLRPGLHDEVETIVLTCLAKEPARRYQSAGELLRDVRAHLLGEPIAAKGDSTFYLLRKTLARHRVAVAFAASVLLLLTAGFFVSLAFWRRAEAARADAEAGWAAAEEARASAEHRADGAQLVNVFFTELLESAGTLRLAGAAAPAAAGQVSVDELLAWAEPRLRERFRDDPQREAEVRSILGRGWLGLGEFERAAEEFEQVLAVRRDALGDLHAQTLVVKGLLGESKALGADPAEGELLLRAVVPLLERSRGARDGETVRLRTALAHAVAFQGRVHEGAEIIVEVLRDVGDEPFGDGVSAPFPGRPPLPIPRPDAPRVLVRGTAAEARAAVHAAESAAAAALPPGPGRGAVRVVEVGADGGDASARGAFAEGRVGVQLRAAAEHREAPSAPGVGDEFVWAWQGPGDPLARSGALAALPAGTWVLLAPDAPPGEEKRRAILKWTYAEALSELDHKHDAAALLLESCRELLSSLGPEHELTRKALSEVAALSHELEPDERARLQAVVELHVELSEDGAVQLMPRLAPAGPGDDGVPEDAGAAPSGVLDVTPPAPPSPPVAPGPEAGGAGSSAAADDAAPARAPPAGDDGDS